jgi:hypothetical protein
LNVATVRSLRIHLCTLPRLSGSPPSFSVAFGVANPEKNEDRFRGIAMADTSSTLNANDTPGSASPPVICEEFLKVLGRKEVEQPIIW